MNSNKDPSNAATRRAMTLMELLAATFVLGLLVTMALPYFGHASLANAGARGFARRLALDAVQTQRRAISTGDNHYLQFTIDGGYATEYALYRRDSGTDPQVDDLRPVPANVQVTVSANEYEFNFIGEALAAYTTTVSSSDRTYQVTIVAATGKVTVTEI